MSDLDSLKESALESSFDVSLCASCLSYYSQSPQGFPILFPGSCFQPLDWRGYGGLLLVPLLPVMTGAPFFFYMTNCD